MATWFKKLESFLLYVLIFLLPFNQRYIFNFAQIEHLPFFKEPITISLYLFDIVLLLLMVLSFSELSVQLKLSKINKTSAKPVKSSSSNITSKTYRQKLTSLARNAGKHPRPLIYFALFLWFSFFLTNYYQPIIDFNLKYLGYQNNWYFFLRLNEGLLLFWLTKRLLDQYTVANYAKAILFFGGVIQAVIACGQFFRQKALGLYFLGESHFNSEQYGVAKFLFDHQKFIRAYGTFPHPNILGFFLLLALAAGFNLLKNKQDSFRQLRWPYKLIILLGFIIIEIGLLLTYSRLIIFLSFILITLFLYSQKRFLLRFYQTACQKLKIPFFLRSALIIVLFFTAIFTVYNLISPRLCLHCPSDESLHYRQLYNKYSREIIKGHYFLGIGGGNFLPGLLHYTPQDSTLSPWRYQPVHNIYLLITAELGLIGLLLFLFLLFFSVNPWQLLLSLPKQPLKFIFIAVIIIGFFDHYFWTTPQGQWLFWLSLAFIFAGENKKIDSPLYHFNIVLKNIRQLLREIS